MNTLQRYGPFAARILLALIFVISGVGKVGGFQGTVGYIQSAGLPAADLLAIGAIVIELAGGAMLVLGWQARWAAAALFVYTLLAGLFFHAFWSAPADQAMLQQIQFLKNIAIMGGMLMVVVNGAGPLSLDQRK